MQASEHQENEIARLRSEKSSLKLYLIIISVALLISVFLLYGAHNKINAQSEMIGFCEDDISSLKLKINDASEAINDMNDKLDSIASTASGAYDSDYDAQADALEGVANEASFTIDSDSFDAASTSCITRSE